MTPISLDLTSSKAKLARAREHFEALQREVAVVLDEQPPYAVRFSEVDPQSGWCSVYITPRDADKERLARLGVIFGDVIHNLRCALDYVVVALVEASGAKVTRSHQFPIYDNAKSYRASVGTPHALNKNGALCGIQHGADLVERLQPYKLEAEPHADPLWHVRRFSNADKHRQVAAVLTLLGPGSIRIVHASPIVGFWAPDELPLWTAEQEYEVGRRQFAPPYPLASELGVEGNIGVDVTFGTPPIGEEKLGHAIKLPALGECCDHVATVLDRFGLL